MKENMQFLKHIKYSIQLCALHSCKNHKKYQTKLAKVDADATSVHNAQWQE